MTFAVFDFVAIAKEAKLSDGRPQNVVQPLSVDPGSSLVQPTEPQWFYGGSAGADTAPAEWVASDFDSA